jgi:pimeloyl-ACP methyl ester carboxylesterase
VAVDDVGAPAGAPVLYLHGTPDSRLSRHPDDGLAAAGVRLLALDRPGYGATSPLPVRTGVIQAREPGLLDAGSETDGPDGPDGGVAGDAAAVLDALGLGSCAVLAWSGGALDALTVAAHLGDRVTQLGIVAGLVPRQAFDDDAVRVAAPGRLGLLDLADELPRGELADVVAPMLAPWPCDRALAAEHQADQRDATGTAEVAAVAGAAERLADGLVEAVRPGLAGVGRDVEVQNRPFPVDLRTIAGPVHLWWGADDTVTPPAFGAWYAGHLPGARLEVVAGAGHHVALTRWADLLRALAGPP